MTESYQPTESEQELFNLAQTLFEGSFGEIVLYLKRQISEELIMRILIDQLRRFKTEQQKVFDWISETETSRSSRSPIGLFDIPQYSDEDEDDPIMDKRGNSVYWLEIHIPHANKLVTNLLQKIRGRHNTHYFFFGNNLHKLKDDTRAVTFGYVGQTSATSPRERFNQHKQGRSGARLIEAIMESYPEGERDEIKFSFCVISSGHSISALAGKLGDLGLDERGRKVVTNVAEIININILKTANIYSCMGLNVEYGRRFGGAGFDAEAAGRGNLKNFTERMIMDLETLFPDTGYRCQAVVPCENALRLERGSLYAYCQRCAVRANQTYIVARVVTQENGEKTVVEAKDQMPKRDAVRIRRFLCGLSSDAYRVNKERGVPFAGNSLIKPIQDIVNAEGWACSFEGCSAKRRRKIELRGLRWYISNWCNNHFPLKRDSGRKWRRMYVNVNTHQWEEERENPKHAGRKRERSDSEQ